MCLSHSAKEENRYKRAHPGSPRPPRACTAWLLQACSILLRGGTGRLRDGKRLAQCHTAICGRNGRKLRALLTGTWEEGAAGGWSLGGVDRRDRVQAEQGSHDARQQGIAPGPPAEAWGSHCPAQGPQTASVLPPHRTSRFFPHDLQPPDFPHSSF